VLKSLRPTAGNRFCGNRFEGGFDVAIVEGGVAPGKDCVAVSRHGEMIAIVTRQHRSGQAEAQLSEVSRCVVLGVDEAAASFRGCRRSTSSTNGVVRSC